MPTGKYVFVKATSDYPGKIYEYGRRVMEHRLVWWQRTGKLVPSGFVLHHKNGNKSDNRFSNLEVKEVGRHIRDHQLKAPDKIIPCSWCGKKLHRTARDVRTKAKKGQKRFFCNGSHAALFGHSIQEE